MQNHLSPYIKKIYKNAASFLSEMGLTAILMHSTCAEPQLV